LIWLRIPYVEADVYVWRYALLVVHASKEEEEITEPFKQKPEVLVIQYGCQRSVIWY